MEIPRLKLDSDGGWRRGSQLLACLSSSSVPVTDSTSLVLVTRDGWPVSGVQLPMMILLLLRGRLGWDSDLLATTGTGCGNQRQMTDRRAAAGADRHAAGLPSQGAAGRAAGVVPRKRGDGSKTFGLRGDAVHVPIPKRSLVASRSDHPSQKRSVISSLLCLSAIRASCPPPWQAWQSGRPLSKHIEA